MKKLNKHPKLFKKIAQTLKKLIMNKIKQLRTKMINNKPSKLQKVKTCSKTGHFPSQRTGKSLSSPDFNGIINLDNIRSIPYDTFYLRITPFDRDTYLKMIEANLPTLIKKVSIIELSFFAFLFYSISCKSFHLISFRIYL